MLSAIIKRIKGFIKLRIALGALHAALPDATSEELRAYDDECAICRVCLALFFRFSFSLIIEVMNWANDRNLWLRLKSYIAITCFILLA